LARRVREARPRAKRSTSSTGSRRSSRINAASRCQVGSAFSRQEAPLPAKGCLAGGASGIRTVGPHSDAAAGDGRNALLLIQVATMARVRVLATCDRGAGRIMAAPHAGITAEPWRA
jgi:hypothetical protein